MGWLCRNIIFDDLEIVKPDGLPLRIRHRVQNSKELAFLPFCIIRTRHELEFEFIPFAVFQFCDFYDFGKWFGFPKPFFSAFLGRIVSLMLPPEIFSCFFTKIRQT